MNEATFRQFLSDLATLSAKYNYQVNPPMNFIPEPLDAAGNVTHNITLGFQPA
jgi:hypothetical protein